MSQIMDSYFLTSQLFVIPCVKVHIKTNHIIPSIHIFLEGIKYYFTLSDSYASIGEEGGTPA